MNIPPARKHIALGADPGTPQGTRLLAGVLEAEWHSHGVDGEEVIVRYHDAGGRARELVLTEEL